MQFRDIINSAAQLQNLKTTHMGHGALDTTIHRQLILLYLLSFVDGHSISFFARSKYNLHNLRLRLLCLYCYSSPACLLLRAH